MGCLPSHHLWCSHTLHGPCEVPGRDTGEIVEGIFVHFTCRYHQTGQFMHGILSILFHPPCSCMLPFFAQLQLPSLQSSPSTVTQLPVFAATSNSSVSSLFGSAQPLFGSPPSPTGVTFPRQPVTGQGMSLFGSPGSGLGTLTLPPRIGRSEVCERGGGGGGGGIYTRVQQCFSQEHRVGGCGLGMVNKAFFSPHKNL